MGAGDPVVELQNLQEELNLLEDGQAEEKEALEKAYLEKCQPLFDRRSRILKGEVEPSDEEAGPLHLDNEEGEDGQDDGKGKAVKGIPHFWLTVLKNQDTTAEHVRKRDEAALEYLEDIRCSRPRALTAGYRVEFHFGPNPFFSDKVLAKEVQLPYFDAPLSKASAQEAPPINWKSAENNLMFRTVTKGGHKKKGGKGKGKGAEASPAAKKMKPCQSFFNFFTEKGGPLKGKKGGRAAEADEEHDEDLGEEDPAAIVPEEFELELEAAEGNVPEDHLEIIMALWNGVVPNAVELYVSGGFRGDEEEVDESDPYAVVTPSEGGIEKLPAAVQRRVRALQYLLGQQKLLKQDKEKGVAKLRQELEKASSGIFDRRKALILGKAQQSGDPEAMAVPRFWLLALKGGPTTVELIRKRDEKLLAYLADVRYKRRMEGPGFHIEFEFLPGSKLWMENRVLTKTFIMVEEGGELLKTESTPVVWQEDMNVTVKTVTTGKGGSKNRPCPSFFQMFDQKRTALLFAGDDTVQLSAPELRDREAELAVALRDSVVPRAVELFETAKEWDHEEEEEEDEEDEDDEDEDEDEDDDAGAMLKKKLRKRSKRHVGKDDDIFCCGMSRGLVFLLLLLLVASSQVFLYLDYILMLFGY